MKRSFIHFLLNTIYKNGSYVDLFEEAGDVREFFNEKSSFAYLIIG